MYDIQAIKNILPHRYPFLMLDRVEEMIDENSAVGYKCVSVNEYYFTGHFPETPVMPGVLIIEAMAQLGAFILLQQQQFIGKLIYFAGIKSAKFRKKVVPGDVLQLKTTVTRIIGHLGFGEGKAYVNDCLVCEADLMFGIDHAS